MSHHPYGAHPGYPPMPTRNPSSPYYQPETTHQAGFEPQYGIADYYADDGYSDLTKSQSRLTPYDNPYPNGGYGSQSSYFQEKPPPMPTPYSPSNSYSGYSPGHGMVHREIMQRRQKQQVVLQDGHLVLDCPVPQSILTMAKVGILVF